MGRQNCGNISDHASYRHGFANFRYKLVADGDSNHVVRQIGILSNHVLVQLVYAALIITITFLFLKIILVFILTASLFIQILDAETDGMA